MAGYLVVNRSIDRASIKKKEAKDWEQARETSIAWSRDKETSTALYGDRMLMALSSFGQEGLFWVRCGVENRNRSGDLWMRGPFD